MARPTRATSPLSSSAAQPAEEHTPFWWLRWVPAAGLTFLILKLLYVVGSVAIVPVLASFALAYILNPLVFTLEKRGLSRTGATLATLMVVSAGVVTLLVFVIPAIWTSG